MIKPGVKQILHRRIAGEFFEAAGEVLPGKIKLLGKASDIFNRLVMIVDILLYLEHSFVKIALPALCAAVEQDKKIINFISNQLLFKWVFLLFFRKEGGENRARRFPRLWPQGDNVAEARGAAFDHSHKTRMNGLLKPRRVQYQRISFIAPALRLWNPVPLEGVQQDDGRRADSVGETVDFHFHPPVYNIEDFISVMKVGNGDVRADIFCVIIYFIY